jgi:hypothetical protein
MASAGEDAVEDALNILVSVTEKSRKLRNDLRKDILKAVSNLRKGFAKLKSEVEDKNKLLVDLEMKAIGTKSALEELQFGVGSSCKGVKETTSLGLNSKDNHWNVALSAGRTRKRYSDVVADRLLGNVPYGNQMHKLFVRFKNNQSAEYTRILLKSKVNPTQMKVGITLKNGQLLNESEKKSELEGLC